MNAIAENVVSTLKRCLIGDADLKPYEALNIENSIIQWADLDSFRAIFDGLSSEYNDFLLGKINPKSYIVTNILFRLIDIDAYTDKRIAKIDIVDATLSWACHNIELRRTEFIHILKAYDTSNLDRNWKEIEQRVLQEMVKLEVYGSKVKGGYLSMLHGFCRIKLSNREIQEQYKLFDLFVDNWDYLRLVYSLMIRSIVDCGHRDFAGVANNARIMTSHHQYIHIFRVVLKERMDELCNAGTSKEKLENHLAHILKIEKGTPQDYAYLSELCTILFPKSFKDYLENNRMKSYDEIAKELKEVKGQVEALNNQVSQMATNMANAVKASIPLKDIEKELLRLSPGISFDVFTQLNTLLIGNKTWLENASRIKDEVIDLRNNPTTQTNINVEFVQKKETNIDKNYAPNIEHNGGTLTLPNGSDNKLALNDK